MDAPLGLRFKKFLSWILSDWALSASMLVLLYVLNHFAITSPHILHFFVSNRNRGTYHSIDCTDVFDGSHLLFWVYFPSSYDFVVPDSQNAAQLKFLYDSFCDGQEPLYINGTVDYISSSYTFRVHGQLGKSFEALVYLAIPMLFLLYDSDGLYLLAKAFSKITAEKSY